MHKMKNKFKKQKLIIENKQINQINRMVIKNKAQINNNRKYFKVMMIK